MKKAKYDVFLMPLTAHATPVYLVVTSSGEKRHDENVVVSRECVLRVRDVVRAF